MALDLLIRNGMVVDGTGRPAYRADIGVEQGRIVEIGKVSEPARRKLDASDLIVVPGFIDPHTHYDAQICWDPLISCSSWHGVTTVIMGNCGVGLAPCKPDSREVATWDLVNVESIPFDVLSEGIKWEWETFPQFMDAAQRRGSGLNLGFLAPLTPFRHYVMGGESNQRAATADETAKIRALIKEAVAAGAMGFSTSQVPNHIGYQAKPLGSRLASRDELRAYASVLKELGHGVVEIAPRTGGASKEDFETLETLLEASGGHVTWLAIIKRYDLPEAHMRLVERLEPLVARGGRPQLLAVPLIGDIDLRSPFMFSPYPCWQAAFNQPAEVQKRLYADPIFRQKFHEELKTHRNWHGNLNMVWVNETGCAALKPLLGKSVAEIAAQRNRDGLDTLLDLALEADLDMRFSAARFEVADELLADPRVMLGLSDGGAHVDLFCDAGYCTELLGKWVREKQRLSLERAVQRITSEPADFFGLKDRGRLLPGNAADFAIFDFNTVGSDSERPEVRFDLPGGGRRVVVPARGMEYSVVNGEVLYEHGKPNDCLPGKVLRSAAS
jgi:N-acyl-D-aspartate/D-glutamate deacylase